MKIVLFEVPKTEQKGLIQLLTGADVSFYEEKLTEENAKKALDAEIVSVFVNSEINKDMIDLLPNLEFLITRSVGFDHIDVAYCKEKGIKVANVPAYGSHTVAEFTFGLLLNLSRKIYHAYHQLREGTDFNISELSGFNLQGKTLGVIGTGKIGKNVVKIAKGFEMNVIAYDVFPDANFAKENNFSYVPLNELLSSSDVVTIHAPYTKETHHLINKENIKLFKKGAYLINTARGEIVETDALLRALKDGIIAGAGLDVLEGERILKEENELFASAKVDRIKDFKTLVEDHILIDLPNVIVTPHMAFYSKEAEEEILKTTAENIKSFISGQPINLVK
jgi:D-lactate dehydrogenase